MNKYIFFDWGYTLISKFNNVDDEINQILSKYNLTFDDIFRYWKNYQLLNSLGKVTEEEIYNDLSCILKIAKEDLKQIDMLLLESHVLEEETKETIIKLYEKGYYLGIISNNSIRNINYILEREGIKKYFNKVVISEEIKERKPNLKVYLEAFKDIKDDYNNIYFVSDELVEDLLSAKILGVNTVWYKQKVENKWKKKEEDITIKPDYEIREMKELLNIIK